MKFNPYKVRRSYGNKIGFFVVNVPENNQWGLGFQFRCKGIVYGLSVTNK